MAKTDNKKVEATTIEIKRLEDLKKQIPLGIGQTSEETRGFTLGTEDSIELESKSAAMEYWEGDVRPELTIAAAYLRKAGMEVSVPKEPSDYSNAGIEQPINMINNKLIDLDEQIAMEGQESTLSKAPG